MVIDPGPDDAGHIEAIREAAPNARGDRDGPAHPRRTATTATGSSRSAIEPTRPADGETVAGLTAIATPGHAAEHLCFLLPADGTDTPASRGDLILGEGSTIVGPREHGGSLADYMDSLRRLQASTSTVLYPGHGPEVARSPGEDRRVHRRTARSGRTGWSRRSSAASARERALLAEVWDDVPEELRGAAAIAMQAHLEKLQDEGRLPADLRE